MYERKFVTSMYLDIGPAWPALVPVVPLVGAPLPVNNSASRPTPDADDPTPMSNEPTPPVPLVKMLTGPCANSCDPTIRETATNADVIKKFLSLISLSSHLATGLRLGQIQGSDRVFVVGLLFHRRF